MVSLRKTFALACGAAFLATASLAGTVTFDLTNQYRSSTDSFGVNDASGLSMTVSGGYYYSGDTIGTSQAELTDTETVTTSSGYGLSVGSHLINGLVDCDTTSWKDCEYARFDFSSAVTFTSFFAGYADAYDDYKVFALLGGNYSLIDAGSFNSTLFGSGGNGDRVTVNVGNLGPATTSTSFLVGIWDDMDEFKIRSVTVDMPMTPVPLPAGGLLLLGGLGALGVMRKRRKA